MKTGFAITEYPITGNQRLGAASIVVALLLLIRCLISPAGLQAEAVLAAETKKEEDPSCLVLAYDKRMGASIPQFEVFFEALYANAGLCAHSIAMTSRRMEAQLLSGEIDGDWVRIEGFEEHTHGVSIGLPQPVFVMPAQFIWLPGTDFSGQPADLKNYRVAYPSGFRWIEWNLEKQRTIGMPLPNEDKVLDLLVRKRIDIFVTGAMNAAAITAQAADANVAFKEAIWQQVPFFHLLHKKHAALVPRLNDALVAMIKSGEAAKILTSPSLTVAPLAAP